MQREVLGAALILAAGVCWGTAGVLSKLLMNMGFSPLAATAYRLVLGFALMTPIILARRKLRAGISRLAAAALVVAGVWGTGLGVLSYFMAVKLTSAQIAVILLYTAPFFAVGLGRVFLGERITGVKVFAAMMAFLGCFLVAKGYSPVGMQLLLPGVLIGVFSGLSYAVYTVCGRVVLRELDSLSMAYWTIGLGAIPLVAAGLATGGFQGPICFESMMLILALALIPTAGAFTLFSSGLKYVEASRASILSSVEVVSAIVLAFIILGERLELLQCVGGAAVLAAVIVLQSSS
ncbi:MAG TPA: hypothetical protein ENF82_04895, partial [Candidatus Methanomethylia archaeon]|nr:hypothetical protein [Candidatus Methanomethylicia archaeon]